MKLFECLPFCERFECAIREVRASLHNSQSTSILTSVTIRFARLTVFAAGALLSRVEIRTMRPSQVPVRVFIQAFESSQQVLRWLPSSFQAFSSSSPSRLSQLQLLFVMHSINLLTFPLLHRIQKYLNGPHPHVRPSRLFVILASQPHTYFGRLRNTRSLSLL